MVITGIASAESAAVVDVGVFPLVAMGPMYLIL
jgi:hypothetical protein